MRTLIFEALLAFGVSLIPSMAPKKVHVVLLQALPKDQPRQPRALQPTGFNNQCGRLRRF